MQFKVKKIKITFSFSFLALILILMILNKTRFLYLSIVFAFLHECGHLFMLEKYGAEVSDIKISLFGGNIIVNNYKQTNYLNDIMVSLAGPIINLVFAIVFYFCNLFFENSFFKDGTVVNFVLGTFNLLPFHSFDGGKIFESILKTKFAERTVNLITIIISLVILVPFTCLSGLVFFENRGNFYFVIFSVLMLLTVILKM